MANPLDPTCPDEWQHAADSARLFTLIDSARQYGFVTGGPDVDLDRCDELLTRAAALGIQPRPDPELLAAVWPVAFPHPDQRRLAR